MKKALVCGISGQDGAYLTKLLLEKGYQIIGTSRDTQSTSFENLKKINVFDKISLENMSLLDFKSVHHVISKVNPDEIYNLAGQTSVAFSFEQPIETFESIMNGTLNILEAIRITNNKIKFYNAGSSESFGNTENGIITETNKFQPVSPYGVAKAASFWQVDNYRNAYNLFSVTGILFNHESRLRHKKFVTKKIISAACKIKNGSDEKLTLGDLSIKRDWGWAPEYVDAMWRMLQLETPQDFIIATGNSNTLENFVRTTFEHLNLDWRDHVVIDKNLFRPSDLRAGKAVPEKAENLLGWKAKVQMNELISILIEEELANN